MRVNWANLLYLVLTVIVLCVITQTVGASAGLSEDQLDALAIGTGLIVGFCWPWRIWEPRGLFDDDR